MGLGRVPPPWAITWLAGASAPAPLSGTRGPMVSQALTGTAPGPCGSPEPRPATPPVWGSACQITNCDRRRWTLSRSIMSSCKLGPKIPFLSYTHSPSHFHISFQFPNVLSFHVISFRFYFISFQSAASLPEGAFSIQFHPIAIPGVLSIY